jgi:hypothetical protein
MLLCFTYQEHAYITTTNAAGTAYPYWRIWKIMYIPYWQIYGELFLDTFQGKYDNCI